MSGSRAALGLAGLLACAACNPYQRFGKDDDALGPVDPVSFPPANLGTTGNRMQPGVGYFTETAAFVAGAAVGYFPYALPAPSPATADLLRLREDGQPYASKLASPTAYLFDPGCVAPASYQYNLKTDEVRYDVQGTIFTALPSATYTAGVAVSSRYTPLVAVARARIPGVPCQKLKSDAALTTALGKAPDPDGTYQAALIIDAAAGVYAFDDPDGKRLPDGLGLQSWGWYRRYLLAYLDGGPIPTAESEVNDGTMAMPKLKKVVRMVPQKLYIPRSMVISGTGTMAAGARGAGYDVLAAKRGEPGYSPLCEVTTYDAGMPLAPDALPRDAKTIEVSFGATLQPAATRYVFCLQVQK
jgi:hypothetical protein